MTEYWVSKKQYYCKYCSIYIRDDAPSRKQHETGLKHIGNVERYIRELYKTGSMAKKDKAAEEAEMARIEASAAAAYANDKASGLASTSTSKPSILKSLPSASTPAASSSSTRVKDKPVDRYSNYSTAESLGYKEEKSEYEIQQEIKNSVGQPTAWETVVIPPPKENSGPGEGEGEMKRKWQADNTEDEENEGWKFDHKGKKPVKDLYQDDWDPSSLKGIKIKKKEEKIIVNPNTKEEDNNGLNRDEWTGKLEFNTASTTTKPAGKEGLEYIQGNGWVKAEEDNNSDKIATNGAEKGKNGEDAPDIKPNVEDVNGGEEQKKVDTKPVIEGSPGGGSMFKKRRPPPSSRKK